MKLKLFSVSFVGIIYGALAAANQSFNPLDWHTVAQGVIIMSCMIGVVLFTLNTKK